MLLFAAAFLYRAFYRDVILLQQTDNPMGFADGMREMILLCVLLAMTLLSLGMRKRVRDRKARDTQPVPAPAPSAAVPAAPEVTAPVPAPVPADPPAAPAEAELPGSDENSGI